VSPTTLSPIAVGLALLAALLHATWNTLLARVPRGHDTTAVALAIGLLAWTPLALARWRVSADVWVYVAASAAFELAYFAALNLAYVRTPAHTTYPIARGLAPVLLLAATAVGTRTTAMDGLAIAVASTGILLSSRGATDRKAAVYALPVAVCIAGYTFVDSRGLRYADSATYLWLVMIPVVLVLLAARLIAGHGAMLRAELRLTTMAVGVSVFSAYGLVLAALALVTTAQVPAVAAIRESSLLFIIVFSWWAASKPAANGPPDLKEQASLSSRPNTATVIGALLIFGGVAILALK
jgi:hypothetical protein